MQLSQVLLATLGLLAVFSNATAQEKPQAARMQAGVPVVVAVVTAQDVPVWLRGIGQVKPQQSVEIRPQVDGLLQQVLVREGDMVEAGQLLATLDDRAIKAALAQAQAQRAVAEAKLNVAKRDLKRYQNLSQSQAISAQQKDQQQATVATATSRAAKCRSTNQCAASAAVVHANSCPYCRPGRHP